MSANIDGSRDTKADTVGQQTEKHCSIMRHMGLTIDVTGRPCVVGTDTVRVFGMQLIDVVMLCAGLPPETITSITYITLLTSLALWSHQTIQTSPPQNRTFREHIPANFSLLHLLVTLCILVKRYIGLQQEQVNNK